MKKTLFIQVDNTPVPTEAENEVVILDCRQINDFCSLVGDALVGDLKDKDGTPFYRLLNTKGRLIRDFAEVDKASYDEIIVQCLDVLCAVLLNDNTQCDNLFTINFPQQYTNWLQTNTNEYIGYVGDALLDNDNSVVLSRKVIIEEIIQYKISKEITEELSKNQYEFIVFSNQNISSEAIVKEVLSVDFNGTHFITFTQLKSWGNFMEERRQHLESTLTYERLYKQYESFINQQITNTFENVMTGLEFIQGFAFFANFSLWPRDKIGKLFEDKDFRHTFFESEKELGDKISVKVQSFREDNEFKIYNEYEEKICRTLGIDFVPAPQKTFRDYYYPIDYLTAIRNFVDIIADFNEHNANEDLGIGYVFSSVHSFVSNESNYYVDELRKSLLDYYKYYCLWNLKYSLQRIWEIYKPEVKHIKESNSSKGCYITTAMCSYLGKKDNCYELTILRGFRDNWLYCQTNGESLIQKYYNYAPAIVDKLKHAPDKDSIYSQINKCIYLCLSYIREQQFEMAKDAYISMVKVLSNKYLTN